jgi:hypothetical protein
MPDKVKIIPMPNLSFALAKHVSVVITKFLNTCGHFYTSTLHSFDSTAAYRRGTLDRIMPSPALAVCQGDYEAMSVRVHPINISLIGEEQHPGESAQFALPTSVCRAPQPHL